MANLLAMASNPEVSFSVATVEHRVDEVIFWNSGHRESAPASLGKSSVACERARLCFAAQACEGERRITNDLKRPVLVQCVC